MQSFFRRIEILFLTGLLFFTVAGFFVPAIANAQLRADDTGASRPIPVYDGVEESIREYLCTPGETQAEQATALADCVSRLYRFSITAGGVALVFFIVVAGYIYITSGEAGKGRAKDILLSALTGMGILLGSYALLSFVNLNLVKVRPIQPPIFTATGLPSCEAVGFGVKCITKDGQVNSPGGGVPGSASEAQYKGLIARYAQSNQMEYCALSALIQKESTFNRLARSNPPGSINESAGPPTYGQSFSDFHAIGLTQITIYPKSRGGWVGDIPARSSPNDFGKSPLTLEMLLNAETNISAGAHYFGKLIRANRNNLYIAYDDFQSGPGDTGAPGKPDSDPKTLDKYMDMYNACKLRS